MSLDRISHYSVMLEEVKNLIKKPNIIVDSTFGGGGYSKYFLKNFENCKVISFDRDKYAETRAEKLNDKYKSRFKFYHSKFSQIEKFIKKDLHNVTHFVYDLGVSNYQLKDLDRGFSYRSNTELKMTMGINEIKATNLLNEKDEKFLSKIIKLFGDEKDAKRIARNIILFRKNKKIVSSEELKKIILKSKKKYQKKDPYAQTFQALRMVVNQELTEIFYSLKSLMENCSVGTTFIIISFHSLEDKLIKNIFNFFGKSVNQSRYLPQKEKKVNFKIFKKKPMVPKLSEIRLNPSSRSAKLRFIQKTNNHKIFINKSDTKMEEFFNLEEKLYE